MVQAEVALPRASRQMTKARAPASVPLEKRLGRAYRSRRRSRGLTENDIGAIFSGALLAEKSLDSPRQQAIRDLRELNRRLRENRKASAKSADIDSGSPRGKSLKEMLQQPALAPELSRSKDEIDRFLQAERESWD